MIKLRIDRNSRRSSVPEASWRERTTLNNERKAHLSSSVPIRTRPGRDNLPVDSFRGMSSIKLTRPSSFPALNRTHKVRSQSPRPFPAEHFDLTSWPFAFRC
eukprot:XP_001701110.1 predicted protein [Chlamydomonas reinhardtii]